MNIKISRETVFDKLRIERIPHLNAGEIKNIFSEMQEVYNEDTLSEQMIAKVVLEFIKYEFRGAPNDYLAKAYSKIMGESTTVFGDYVQLLPCPCCKARSLAELYDPSVGTGYDICGNCGWEDGGTSSRDVRSSVNRGTINEYLALLQNKENEHGIQRWEFEDHLTA